MADLNSTNGSVNHEHYSVPKETENALTTAIFSNPLVNYDLPPEIAKAASRITFTGSDMPSIPVNWRFAEAVAALKALEAALVNVLLMRKYDKQPQPVTINTDHAVLFIFSALLWTIDPGEGGLNFAPDTLRGANKTLEQWFPSYDKYGMNSSMYRNQATNIYKCEDGKYFHIHNSMNPDPTLDCLGLPRDVEVSSYEDANQPFIEAFSRIDSEDMQKRYDAVRQAGTICYSVNEFLASEHGKANAHVGLWEIRDRPNATQKPSWWPDSPQTGPSRPLAGLKVVDLTRIIAAPCITRSLAELGASVMRCTSPNLPDVSSLHVDLNQGKWNCSIDLNDADGREKLRALIEDADVVVQGYRPHSLDKFGFGEVDILKMCGNRDRGIIYVRENSYGWHGPWQGRSGWQQISDANTGISLEFGRAMGNDEPVTPVFPHSDYCTGISGSCAIIIALLRRAEKGGSYSVDVALNYYNTWLVNSVGTYPQPVFDKVWAENDRTVYRHWHNNTYIIPKIVRKLKNGPAGKRLFNPEFWEDRSAPGILGKKKIRSVKPIATWGGLVKPGFHIGTRGNGVDAARWPDNLSVEIVS